MPAPRFGTDGVRGAANTELSVEAALSLGRAAAQELGAQTIVVGRDTRQSGPMLEAALVAGITSAGVNVELLGVVPTPAVAFMARRLPESGQRTAGAMISASHNPFADNGIKLFAPGGLKLSDEVEARIEARYVAILEGDSSVLDRIGTISDLSADSYSRALLQSVPQGALSELHVVLDAAHGSASIAAPDLFGQLCAKVTLIGATPNGININDGVGSTYPASLQAAVVEAGADIGLAFDGDADRLLAVDHTGRLIDGDHILAILAKHWKAAGRLAHDTVVVTVMTNIGFKKAMAASSINVVETAVGDRYVLEALNGGGYSLGGEQSGHVICRDIATTGDGILAGLQLLETVAESQQTLHELANNAMTSFPQVLRNLRLERRNPEILDRMADAIAEAEAELGEDGRVLVRLSGTEPLLRVMVEARTLPQAEHIVATLIHHAETLA